MVPGPRALEKWLNTAIKWVQHFFLYNRHQSH